MIHVKDGWLYFDPRLIQLTAISFPSQAIHHPSSFLHSPHYHSTHHSKCWWQRGACSMRWVATLAHIDTLFWELSAPSSDCELILQQTLCPEPLRDLTVSATWPLGPCLMSTINRTVGKPMSCNNPLFSAEKGGEKHSKCREWAWHQGISSSCHLLEDRQGHGEIPSLWQGYVRTSESWWCSRNTEPSRNLRPHWHQDPTHKVTAAHC